jgi:hypothetical protein
VCQSIYERIAPLHALAGLAGPALHFALHLHLEVAHHVGEVPNRPAGFEHTPHPPHHEGNRTREQPAKQRGEHDFEGHTPL